MNADLFVRWLTSQLLPSLPEPAVLVLDNAPYHNQLSEDSRCPNSSTIKADIMKWLTCRQIPFPPNSTRPELLQIFKQNRPLPVYNIDIIIRSWGHEVARQPPAHPELNAIEQLIEELTHTSGNRLDLIFTDVPAIVKSKVCKNIGTFGHCVTEMTYS
ncbi:uncharacterized protein [Macrobrachium rosenbergii]|uniref:uncharacterized protein n=1 Tax=Macrobrachium rosenbergii TaxID=79674 RepID=UPI0034D679C8